MSLDVQYKNNKTNLSWHVNMPTKQIKENINDIESIFVSGDELIYIKTKFQNLPSTYSFCWYYGDMAKFIVANL